MIEINAFSIIMALSLIGLIPLAIWANKRDYAQIKEILEKWVIGLNLKIWALIYTVNI